MVSFVTKIKLTFVDFYQRHKALVSIFTFAIGFAVDLITFKRVYGPQGLFLQALYLLILGSLLMMEIKGAVRGRAKWWSYHDLIVHFLFGSLLSLYTIFFYSSASALSSFLYILLLGLLLLGNEFGPLKKFGLTARVLLFMVCSLSYFSFLYPILLGRLGEGPFWLGILSVTSTVAIIWFANYRWARDLKKQVLYPALLMIMSYVVAYYTSAIPPVPLAVKKIGVYHQINKSQGTYSGLYLPESQKFWGADEFLARKGDKINILLSIFSPMRFQDQVHLKWYFKGPEGWILKDSIPLSITGGRERGFRGFGAKEIFEEGYWRVTVDTADGREAGRINFRVINDQTQSERFFLQDLY